MSELQKHYLFYDLNLKAYYRFENGSLVTDSTANGLTLTNNNTVGEAQGIFNRGADFGAANTNKYFSRADGLSVDLGTGAYSVNGWVKLQALPGTSFQLIDWKSTTTTPSYFQLFYQLNTSTYKWYTQFGDTGQVFTNIIGLGAWTMFTATCDAAGNCKFYANGIQLFTDTRANSNAGNNLGIGASSAGGTPSAVFMDDISFWNRVLTPTEIQSLFNSSGFIMNNYQGIKSDSGISVGEKIR